MIVRLRVFEYMSPVSFVADYDVYSDKSLAITEVADMYRIRKDGNLIVEISKSLPHVVEYEKDK